MKKLMIMSLLSAFSVFAADPSQSEENDHLPLYQPPIIEKEKSSFTYVRFGAGETIQSDINRVTPGFGLGYRRFVGSGAVDISMNGIGQNDDDYGRAFWNLPKATYLHYFNPKEEKTFYAGAGLSWGGLIRKDQFFTGIITSATFGHEFIRDSALGFAEINLSQAILPVHQVGTLPKPVVECSVGMGF